MEMNDDGSQEPKKEQPKKWFAALTGVSSEEPEPAPKSKSFWTYFKESFREAPEENEEDAPADKGGFFRRLKRSYEKAKEEQARTVQNYHLYENISDSSVMSKEFLVLLLGSCLIATFGLYQNSTAVIIGAMLIAPLMMPILGLALASLWGDKVLLVRSFFTLFTGSIAVGCISMLLTLLIPGIENTTEMAARTNPNLYDILVAIASGLVGAYAYVNPRISNSISGVAIAVALMPPLCTVGIMTGLNEIRLAFGALLLYLTNLVGIALAASVVFWRMKVQPSSAEDSEVTERAKRNILVSSALLLLIALPLGYFMFETFQMKKYKEKVLHLVEEKLHPADLLKFELSRFHDEVHVRIIPLLPSEHFQESVHDLKKSVEKQFPHIKFIWTITPVFTRSPSSNTPNVTQEN